MDISQQNAWRREALDMVFRALASSQSLKDQLIFKGARVLSLHLGNNHRASYDLDANLLTAFVVRHQDRQEQSICLKEMISEAIKSYTQSQAIVRYELNSVAVKLSPKDSHQLGWNAFQIKIRLVDLKNVGVRALPTVDFDIAAPEELGPNSKTLLTIGEGVVFAYTLERIAGEKMRAFLSTLKAYRKKVSKRGDDIRAKDVYDIACILREKPLSDFHFWHAAGDEFRLACESRYVDCSGIATFEQDLELTRTSYGSDAFIPKDIEFDAAWRYIQNIVTHWESLGIIPFNFPLPAEE